MSEVSPDGSSREESYSSQSQSWHLDKQLSSFPPLSSHTKICARIEHSLNCPTPRAWRALVRDLSEIIQSTPEQQEVLMSALLHHQGCVYDTAKKYDRDTIRVLDACTHLLEITLSTKAMLSPKVLATLVSEILPHIQQALGYERNSSFDLEKALSYSLKSLALLKLTLAHIDKNPDAENLATKHKIALFFDLVVFDPTIIEHSLDATIIEHSRLNKWKRPEISHYTNLVEFTYHLAEQRFSQPLCNLLNHVKKLKNEINLQQSSGEKAGDKFVIISENADMLEKAALIALSTCHQGPKARVILAHSWRNLAPHSTEFRATLLGLSQTDIAETHKGCEYLALALIEDDRNLRHSMLKKSVGSLDDNQLEIQIGKYEKVVALLAHYLLNPVAVDVFYNVADQLVTQERKQLITALKFIKNNAADSFNYLEQASSGFVIPPILTQNEITRLGMLIECLEKLPLRPFKNGREYLSRSIVV